MTLMLQLAGESGLRDAQHQVEEHHYLHRPVDSRCSPLAYQVMLRDSLVGCLIFGRPEATRVNGWYGSVEDVQAGRCPLTRWQVLNLARVWLHPIVQEDGLWCSSEFLPGFVDRHGVWHSRLASAVVGLALERVGYDYLLAHPPCFLDEPWAIVDCLSYCDTTQHKGTLYRAANFRLVRENERGIQTYVRPLPCLTLAQRATIEKLATDSPRSKRYRATRANAHYEQATLFPVA